MPSTQAVAKWSVAVTALLAVVFAVLFFNWKLWTVGEHFMQASTPECPHEWKTFAVKGQHEEWERSFSSGLSVPGPITNVPEYHDCQRFITSSGFGPLTAVFAAFKLDSLATVLDRHVKESLSVGQNTVRTRAFALAEVFQHNGLGYQPLGIAPGFNCLFMYGENGILKARMVPVGRNEEQCAASFDPGSTSGTALTVSIRTLSGFKSEEYPPVARWDRAADGSYYIGLKCKPVEWCEVGIGAAAPSPYYSSTPATVTPDDRVRLVKGWHDEQTLAVLGSGTDLVPGAVTGQVFPSPTLGTNGLDAYTNKWVTTGHIAIGSQSSQYKTMLNLDAVPPASALAAMNTIEMCYGTSGGCLIPAGHAFPDGTCGWMNSVFSKVTARWWARITAAGDKTVAYRCVIRRDHMNAGVDWVPGTARWRWKVNDETVWEECVRGCCEIETGIS